MNHTPFPWDRGSRVRHYHTPEGKLYRLEVGSTEGHGPVHAVKDPTPEDEANAALILALPEMAAALVDLVAADNCNYRRDVMRSEGYFARAAAALKKAFGTDDFTAIARAVRGQ